MLCLSQMIRTACLADWGLWLAREGFRTLGDGGVFAAIRLRFAPGCMRYLASVLPIWFDVKSVVFHVAKLARGWRRDLFVIDLLRLVTGNLVGSTMSCVAIRCIAPPGFPGSVYLLDLMIWFLAQLDFV